MGWLSRMFGEKDAPKPSQAAQTSFPPSQLNSQAPTVGAGPKGGTRRELLRVVLRDTLNRHGIPANWMSAEMLLSTSRTGEQGIHWRLLVKHWDPRLMTHSVALQQSLIKRVMTFDPLASSWLTGISWQLALADESMCPPLPHPGVWTQPAPAEPAVRPVREAAKSQASGDVIAGPVHIPDSVKAVHSELDPEAKADLEKLFAIRDADYNRTKAGEATQPLYIATEPSPLN